MYYFTISVTQITVCGLQSAVCKCHTPKDTVVSESSEGLILNYLKEFSIPSSVKRKKDNNKTVHYKECTISFSAAVC